MTEERPIQGVGGPFITAATFCERVLEEKDGVHTLIRLIDRYWIELIPGAPPPPPDAKPAIDAVYFLMIKAGDFRGPATVRVRLRQPSGAYSLNDITAPISLEGGETGVTLQINMRIAMTETGIYWAEVELDGRPITRTPLRIEWRSTTTSDSSSPSTAR